LSIARDDLGFFPRIHLLGLPVTLISFTRAGQQQVRPAFDTYGYRSGVERVTAITSNWKAPYTSISEARRSFAQGTKLLVKMRLPEPENLNFPTNTALGDISLVDWPSDIWGNPYVVYLVVSDANAVSSSNPLGMRLVSQPNENPNYWTAVVSYGPNGVPGGNQNVDQDPLVGKPWHDNVLVPASLVVRGDLANNGAAYVTGGQPIYTLKSANTQITGASLLDSRFLTVFPQSIVAGVNADPNQIGIRDIGSDDVYWVF
jgi:hypothetical protein